MKNKKVIKVIGVVAMILGLGAEMVSDWVDEKMTEDMIDKKIKKALGKE